MRRPAPTFQGKGYTLIELLAVIVIMALTAGFIVPGLAAVDDAARCRSIAAKLRGLDRTARLFARADGQIALNYDSESKTFLLTAHESRERLAALPLDADVIVDINVEAGELPILFERTGRSADYTVAVSVGAHANGFRVAGSTGRIAEVTP